ncbi:Response regulator MprA [Methylobrevis pamukkalensis]|uniref:Response regulator MprA n=1 Tax=Methylobrevis pamukkalensis TaxID=1439726 RepID=A0A1E3H8X2_9HYPH|nr:Response regulator MprA [Methylobrevis pamukkalensis]
MTEILKPLGFALLTARSGAECLDLVTAARPDLFLLDISMPGMSGWDLARALRRSGHDKATIIMVSANLGDGQLGPGGIADVDAVHDDLLPKPFDLATLLDRIGQHLKLDWIEEGEDAAQEPDAERRRRHSFRRPTGWSCCGSAASATCAASRCDLRCSTPTRLSPR